MRHSAIASFAIPLLGILPIITAGPSCKKTANQADHAAPGAVAPTAKPSAVPAPAAKPAGGALDVQEETNTATKLNVGAAFVDLYPSYETPDSDDAGPPKITAYKFNIRVFNDGATNPSCTTELDSKNAVGGTNWALGFDTLNSNEWHVGSKDPLPLSPSFFFKDDHGLHGEAPWADSTISKNEVFIESLSDQAVTFKMDIENDGFRDNKGWIRGTFTAKVCKIEKL